MEAVRLGKYRLIRQLAVGGMGEVYLARQEGPAGFSKPAVIKRILPHLAKEQAFVEMFLNEARMAALLSHPNVVQIFELGEADGTWFIAMEYIHGQTLRAAKRALKEQSRIFPPHLLAHVAAQALHGLQYAHTLVGPEGEQLDVIHRDLSPDNVMVGFNGQVKVLDFGIAKAVSASSTTRSGAVKGKFAYMPPEQLLGEPLDCRADLYAMGVVLFELLTMHKPFSAPTDPALVNKILNTPVPSMRELAPDVPQPLVAIVERALSKDRTARFGSAQEMAQALESFAASSGAVTNSSVIQFWGELFKDQKERPPGLTPTHERDVPLIDGGVDVVFTQATPSNATSTMSRPAPTPTVTPVAEPRGEPTPKDEPAARAALPKVPGPKQRRTPVAAIAVGVALGVVAIIGAVLVLQPKPPPATTGPVGTTGATGGPGVVPPTVAPLDAAVAVRQVEPIQPTEVAALDAAVEPLPLIDAGLAAKPADAKPVELAPGSVQLRVNPYAEVFLGAKRLGVTPMPPIKLPAGSHVLTLKNDELQLTRKVTVRVQPGQTSMLRVDLME